MEPILAGAQPPVTIAAYVALNTAGRQPYKQCTIKMLIVLVILAKKCMFESLRDWLAQNQSTGNLALIYP